MIVRNIKDVEAIRFGDVKGLSVRWLVHSDLGGEEYKHNYAIRYFTMEPGVVGPMHSHDYVQTPFSLSGEVIITTDKEEKKLGPGDLAYIPSYQPHRFTNASQTEEATFTCTIDCPGGKATCSPPSSSGD